MNEPFRLTAFEAARRIASGALTSEALVRSCLDRIEAREPTVEAWVTLDREQALAEARARDKAGLGAGLGVGRRGGLHGIPIAIKDVIETRRLPTEFGSAIFRGHRPKRDAAVVKASERQGGIILGKAVTTQFATFAPNKTRNPHNPAHTPGGSSSGSAAAVGDFHVPLAVGTQTVGSVIRPASFCGAAAFKPSFGAIDIRGTHPLAVSFDTLGLFGRHADDLWLFFAALTGGGNPLDPPQLCRPRVALCITPEWATAEPAMRGAVTGVAKALQDAGADTREIEFSASFSTLAEVHQVILAYEVARDFRYLTDLDPAPFAPQLQILYDEGQTITDRAYRAALRTAETARDAFDRVLFEHGLDLLLTPSAPGEAPRGLASTGDARFNRIWTFLRAPCASFPVARGPRGLPLGVQFVGPRSGDVKMLAHLRWIWRALGPEVTLPA